jgi:hypothetical protein
MHISSLRALNMNIDLDQLEIIQLLAQVQSIPLACDLIVLDKPDPYYIAGRQRNPFCIKGGAGSNAESGFMGSLQPRVTKAIPLPPDPGAFSRGL